MRSSDSIRGSENQNYETDKYSMKTALLFLVFLFTLGSAMGQTSPPAKVSEVESGPWTTASPANGVFTVMLPGKASETTAAVEGRPGIENHVLTLETKLAGYVVSFVEFPEEIIDPIAVKKILDSGRDGGLASGKAELVSEKELKFGEFSGREWIMKLPSGLETTARAYWVKRSLYQLIFVTSPTATDSAELVKHRHDVGAKFFDSFTLAGATGK